MPYSLAIGRRDGIFANYGRLDGKYRADVGGTQMNAGTLFAISVACFLVGAGLGDWYGQRGSALERGQLADDLRTKSGYADEMLKQRYRLETELKEIKERPCVEQTASNATGAGG